MLKPSWHNPTLHPRKAVAMILLERIRPTFHNHRRSEQAGFTAGRSTTEQMFAIRQVIEKWKEFNKSTYIAFIDFKAAFDSVSRDSLWKILQICGVPQELSVLVRQLYTHTRTQRGAPRFLSVRRVLHRDWREARMCHCTRPLQLCNRPPDASPAGSL